MVTCTAISCGINYITSKKLNISLYRLPREETLKIAWKQKLRLEKMPADENISMQFGFLTRML